MIRYVRWGEVQEDIGARREQELKGDYWQEMIKSGCKIRRFQNTFESAWDIVDSIPERDQAASILLSTQMVEHHLRLNETKVGRKLNEDLQKLIKDRKDAARRLKEQAHRADHDPVVVQELNERQQEIENKIEDLAGQIMQLKIPLGRKIKRLFNFL